MSDYCLAELPASAQRQRSGAHFPCSLVEADHERAEHLEFEGTANASQHREDGRDPRGRGPGESPASARRCWTSAYYIITACACCEAQTCRPPPASARSKTLQSAICCRPCSAASVPSSGSDATQ